MLNYPAIIVASIAQFVVGAIWYMPLFGKLWGRIHGFDKVAPETQKEMMKGMPPFLALQFAGTVVTTTVFSLMVWGLPAEWNLFGIAAFLWLGFVVPTQVGAVIFGGTEPRWFVKKILIMAFGSLACLQAMAAVFSWF